jgi:hypothetical protein
VNKTLTAIVLAISVSSTHAEEVPDSYSLEAPAYCYNKAIETCPTICACCQLAHNAAQGSREMLCDV